MKEYIVTIMLAGVAGSLVLILAPEGEGGGLSRYLRYATALVMAAVCLMPLGDAIQKLSELDLNMVLPEYGEKDKEHYEDLLLESYNRAELENLRAGISGILYENFGIAESDCTVSVRVREDRSLEQIFIRLYNGAIWKDTGEIEDYLSSLLRCDVITAIG